MADLTPALQLQIALNFEAPGLAFDFSCFGLDAAGKLSDARYFIFFNQKASPENALELDSLSSNGAQFSLDLAWIPDSISRLVLVATVDGEGAMNALKTGQLTLRDPSGAKAEFRLRGSDFGVEKAIMVAEIYRKDVWRVAAVGQGFALGLSAVLKHFGGEEIEETPAPSLPPAKIETPKTVNLTKPGSSFTVNLTKDAAEIVATAQWVDNGDARSDNDDLDLRAGILWPDGRMSIVTCDKAGSLQKAPFVLHGGDVQNASQSAPGQETMRVNSTISQKMGGPVALVFSVYSAVGNGVVSIASLRPKMTLQFGAQVVNCELDLKGAKIKNSESVYTYVLGTAIVRGQQVEISPGGQFSAPGNEATPWLAWDTKGGVKLTIDGPWVFKGEPDDLDLGDGKRYI